jgi:uncharacterized protein YfaS (alpha-2-macroglobulin family)
MDRLGSYLQNQYYRQQELRRTASAYYYQSYLQAYNLYVFSLMGLSVDASRLAEIASRQNADASVLAFAGMTYLNLGRNTEAADMARQLRNLMRFTTRGADITDPVGKSRWAYYGGPVEQLALSLQFFAQYAPGDDINTRLLYSLLEQKRSDGFWESTAVTVRVLSAVDALIQAENLENIDVTGDITLGSIELLQGAFKGLGAEPVSASIAFDQAPLLTMQRDTGLPLVISRAGTGSLYYSASMTYAIPNELQSSRDEGIGVFVSIYDVDTGEQVSGTALRSGKTYRMEAAVSSTMDRTYLALRLPVPSGAEILDSAFVTTASYDRDDTGSSSTNRNYGRIVSHRVIMDNEAQYFWDNFTKGETTVSFLFRAVRRGVYPTPPAQAECMYESEIFGRSAGTLYTIE